MKNGLQNLLKFILFFSVGAVIMYLLYQNLDAGYQEHCVQESIPSEDCNLIDKIVRDFKSAKVGFILLALFAYLLSNVSRAMRWEMLLQPLGYKTGFLNRFFTVMLGYFVNLGLPRAGEFARAGALSRYEKLPVEKVMGTIVIGRAMDFIMLFVVIGLAMILEFEKIWSFLSENIGQKFTGTTLMLLGVFALLGLGGLGFLYKIRTRFENNFLYKKIMGLLEGLWEGLKSVSKLSSPLTFIAHSIFIWLMYYSMNYLIMQSFVPTEHLGMTAALVVFLFGGLGIVIPSPGGLGSYHALAIASLLLYGVNEFDAFSFANINFFSIQIGCNLLIGFIALLLLPIINKTNQTTDA